MKTKHLRIRAETLEQASDFAKRCGAPLDELVERTLRVMMSIEPGALGVVLPLDQAKALAAAFLGNRFEMELADAAINRIDAADEIAREIARATE